MSQTAFSHTLNVTTWRVTLASAKTKQKLFPLVSVDLNCGQICHKIEPSTKSFIIYFGSFTTTVHFSIKFFAKKILFSNWTRYRYFTTLTPVTQRWWPGFIFTRIDFILQGNRVVEFQKVVPLNYMVIFHIDDVLNAKPQVSLTMPNCDHFAQVSLTVLDFFWMQSPNLKN